MLRVYCMHALSLTLTYDAMSELQVEYQIALAARKYVGMWFSTFDHWVWNVRGRIKRNDHHQNYSFTYTDTTLRPIPCGVLPVIVSEHKPQGLVLGGCLPTSSNYARNASGVRRTIDK